jgi:2-polyprenyl-6-hydroxyphenyl methylase/3-demethylubiquinone-9 3-methyltransferase
MGSVDLSKNCEEINGLRLQTRDIPVAYHRCPACGLIFSTAFDDFSASDFKAHIYNDDYVQVDPEITAERPEKCATLLINCFGHARDSLRILDYGSGNGALVDLLRSAGFANVHGYDPFLGQDGAQPNGPFDLILCFEVMEHSPTPQDLATALNRLRADTGIIFYSTLIQPDNIDTLGLNWWYLAPRNGHITLHSAQSLPLLWQNCGLRHASASDSIHIAYDQIPDFARNLFGA